MLQRPGFFLPSSPVWWKGFDPIQIPVDPNHPSQKAWGLPTTQATNTARPQDPGEGPGEGPGVGPGTGPGAGTGGADTPGPGDDYGTGEVTAPGDGSVAVPSGGGYDWGKLGEILYGLPAGVWGSEPGNYPENPTKPGAPPPPYADPEAGLPADIGDWGNDDWKTYDARTTANGDWYDQWGLPREDRPPFPDGFPPPHGSGPATGEDPGTPTGGGGGTQGGTSGNAGGGGGPPTPSHGFGHVNPDGSIGDVWYPGIDDLPKNPTHIPGSSGSPDMGGILGGIFSSGGSKPKSNYSGSGDFSINPMNLMKGMDLKGDPIGSIANVAAMVPGAGTALSMFLNIAADPLNDLFNIGMPGAGDRGKYINQLNDVFFQQGLGRGPDWAPTSAETDWANQYWDKFRSGTEPGAHTDNEQLFAKAPIDQLRDMIKMYNLEPSAMRPTAGPTPWDANTSIAPALLHPADPDWKEIDPGAGHSAPVLAVNGQSMPIGILNLLNPNLRATNGSRKRKPV